MAEVWDAERRGHQAVLCRTLFLEFGGDSVEVCQPRIF